MHKLPKDNKSSNTSKSTSRNNVKEEKVITKEIKQEMKPVSKPAEKPKEKHKPKVEPKIESKVEVPKPKIQEKPKEETKVEVKEEVKVGANNGPTKEQKEVIAQTLNKNFSKDKIKVFNEDDESDIEAHLEESRKKFVDPMDNTPSDSSNPPTPIKSQSKAPIYTTDGSVAFSEGAMKDAKNYVQGVYGKGKAHSKIKDPFDYGKESDTVIPENEISGMSVKYI